MPRVFLSVCLSQVGGCSTEVVGQIKLVSGTEASFDQSCAGNSGTCKNKGTSFSYFFRKSGLRKFRQGISIVEACYQLSSRKMDAQRVINWAVVGQLS